MELLERETEQAQVEAALDEARDGGRVVVVAGEAGIGKTTLVTAACAGRAVHRVLWGGCDPLVTPRPLGPFWDLAREADGPLLDLLRAGAPREEVLGATLALLEDGTATALVVEDLHWADDASLDLVALLARRLDRARGCLLLTCRTDTLRDRPEVRRVLAALPRACVRRIDLRPLSPAAVAVLATRSGRDLPQLHALSGGNPFFVTETLSASPDGAGVPTSVRDALAQRVGALRPDAAAVVELAAVVPGPTDLSLLEATVGADAEAIDACVDAGILTLRGTVLTFRHELARRAVEDELSPLRRRALDRLVLTALEARAEADPARLAHHARRAGDVDAIRRLAPLAAQAAAAAGGHRQALEQWEVSLSIADGNDAAATARALEGVSIEAYLCGQAERSLEARRALLEHHEAMGDERRVGDDLRWVSRLLWWSGHGAEAKAAGDRAIAVLERFPDSHELAMALSGSSQLAMLAERNVEAIALGDRAVAIGRRLGDSETIAHALTNVGTALIGSAQHESGRELLEEAFTLAVEAGLDDHAARALGNLASSTSVRVRDDPRIADDLERALAFARERHLDGYVQYLLGVRSVARLLRGDWAGAEADAHASLEHGDQPGISLCPALTTIGRLQARRGEPEAGVTLQRAWDAAVASRELQRLAPAAASRAEHAWLADDREALLAAVGEAHPLALERGDEWARGELGYWLWRAGAPAEVAAPLPVATPYARALAGDARGAAAAWTALGFPYEAADALSNGDDEDRLEALTAFDALGATRPATVLRRRLRSGGMRRIPRGPRAASRAGPAGLTPRQVQVLELLAVGATNAEIAAQLVVAPKTVDHHVSAVLAKLGVSSRREAAAAAAALDRSDGGTPFPRWGAVPDVAAPPRT